MVAVVEFDVIESGEGKDGVERLRLRAIALAAM